MYEPLPGLLHHNGKQFICPCGNGEFKVEIGPEPRRFWCECGVMYTEAVVEAMDDVQEAVDNGV